MKTIVNRNIITTFFVFALAAGGWSCGGNASTGTVTGSPTEAYKELYAAVKAKNTEAVKAVMSKQSMAFADGAAKRQNITLEKVLENGFTATTFSPALPEIRDERIKDGYGAVEVYNSRESKWEDLPFIVEDGRWKFAVGDQFGGKFQSPGKGRAQLEAEAANAAGKGPTMININANANFPSGNQTNPTINANVPPNPTMDANKALVKPTPKQ